VLLFQKSALVAGDPAIIANAITLTTPNGSAGVPATSDGAAALYFLAHREQSTSTEVQLRALTDPLGLPQVASFTLPVPSYGPPEDPPQAGSSLRPETFDARFWSVAYRDGSLWATHHVDADRVRVRWYEIDLHGWPGPGKPPELVQWGEVDPGSPVRTFFSAITADAAGRAFLTFGRSSPDEFISMATAYREPDDAPGTLRPIVVRRASVGPSQTNRWGDYAGIGVDPTDGAIWAHHEYIEGSWRTWIQRMSPPFDPGDVDGDGAVNVTDLLLVLADWGPCPACPTDIDDDGDVAVDDLLAVLAGWTG
jgi:hypothetical protein